ncbi:MAG: sodium:calcium antiporter, partial [Chloroflexota bacterium]
MVWLVFLLSAFVVVLAATRLAEFGDVLALRTGLGGLFFGVIFIAAATSLPELLTTINAVHFGEINLAAGNLLGSNMVNIAMLVVLDILFRKKRILRTAALKHALSGSLASLLIGAVVFFMLAQIEWQIGWVGIDSLILIMFYFGAVWLLQRDRIKSDERYEVKDLPAGLPGWKTAIFGFLAASAALIYVSPWLIRSTAEIAIITGLGATFIGTTLLALVTSLPELVATISAAKIGADDMAIGNLFGSNMFNMFALGLTDFFYL